MFLPEYTITTRILNNIATLEYAKAVIDNTVILPAWENQVRNEAKTNTLHALLKKSAINIDKTTVKQHVEGLHEKTLPEIKSMESTLFAAQEAAKTDEVSEEVLKKLQKVVGESGSYRRKRAPGKTSPEEILAQVVQLFDWIHTRDALEMHPAISAAVIYAELERIQPFQNFSAATSFLIAQVHMQKQGYMLKDFIAPENYISGTKGMYEQLINSLDEETPDFTAWIKYFTEGMAYEASTVKDQVKLLAKDTKVATTTGRSDLNDRQEKIVVYLKDYGTLRNKDFSRVFPSISEDTVLRQLKSLMEKGIVVKKGSTKSSRYELA
jgi:Fic family protein